MLCCQTNRDSSVVTACIWLSVRFQVFDGDPPIDENFYDDFEDIEDFEDPEEP